MGRKNKSSKIECKQGRKEKPEIQSLQVNFVSISISILFEHLQRKRLKSANAENGNHIVFHAASFFCAFSTYPLFSLAALMSENAFVNVFAVL